MSSIIDQIAQSSLSELDAASRAEKMKAGIYAGAAVVGALVGENGKGFVKRAAAAASIGSGLMAWYHGSKSMVLGTQTAESQTRVVDHIMMTHAENNPIEPIPRPDLQ